MHLWVCIVCFEVVLCMWLHRGLIIIIMINVTFCLSRSSGDHISCLPPINCQESGQSGHYAILLNRFVAYMTWSKLKRLDNDQTFTVDPFKRFLFKKKSLHRWRKKIQLPTLVTRRVIETWHDRGPGVSMHTETHWRRMLDDDKYASVMRLKEEGLLEPVTMVQLVLWDNLHQLTHCIVL